MPKVTIVSAVPPAQQHLAIVVHERSGLGFDAEIYGRAPLLNLCRTYTLNDDPLPLDKLVGLITGSDDPDVPVWKSPRPTKRTIPVWVSEDILSQMDESTRAELFTVFPQQ